jgi:hypothetical protein
VGGGGDTAALLHFGAIASDKRRMAFRPFAIAGFVLSLSLTSHAADGPRIDLVRVD